jgi:hypothetical protein
VVGPQGETRLDIFDDKDKAKWSFCFLVFCFSNQEEMKNKRIESNVDWIRRLIYLL